MSNPTNATIMEAIGELRGEMISEFRAVRADVLAVKDQATKTNGRVTSVENWKNALEAVEKYKKENQQPTVHTEQGNVIVQQPPASFWDAKAKWYIALAGAISVVASAIVAYLAGGGPK